jgi:hypothetical protein
VYREKRKISPHILKFCPQKRSFYPLNTPFVTFIWQFEKKERPLRRMMRKKTEKNRTIYNYG